MSRLENGEYYFFWARAVFPAVVRSWKLASERAIRMILSNLLGETKNTILKIPLTDEKNQPVSIRK